MKYQVDKISRQIKVEKIIKKIFKIIILLFLVVLLIINLIMLYQTANQEELPNICNISALNIISESMLPTIKQNDLIVIKKYTQEEIKVGDIITYKKSDNSIVTHRIVSISKQEGEDIYTTRGDNNAVEDNEKIPYSQVYGKYLFKIQGIGKLAEELQKNNGLISLAIALIIFIIIKNSIDKRKEERKRIREKYDIKKKRDQYSKILKKNS